MHPYSSCMRCDLCDTRHLTKPAWEFVSRSTSHRRCVVALSNFQPFSLEKLFNSRQHAAKAVHMRTQSGRGLLSLLAIAITLCAVTGAHHCEWFGGVQICGLRRHQGWQAGGIGVHQIFVQHPSESLRSSRRLWQ